MIHYQCPSCGAIVEVPMISAEPVDTCPVCDTPFGARRAETGWRPPMLAGVYQRCLDSVRFPACVQPKYDGRRMIWDGPGDVAWGRTGQKLTIPTAMRNALRARFADLRVDGELFSPSASCSAVSAYSRGPATGRPPAGLAFAAFDEQRGGGFRERFDHLQRRAEGFTTAEALILSPTIEVQSHDQIAEWMDRWIGEGYEGLMVRSDVPYVYGRTRELLKLKPAA